MKKRQSIWPQKKFKWLKIPYSNDSQFPNPLIHDFFEALLKLNWALLCGLVYFIYTKQTKMITTNDKQY